MSAPGLRRRLTVALATVATVTLVAALPSVASHAAAKPLPNRFDLQLLALNDFHGNLEPPSGSGGRITVPGAPGGFVLAGGAAFLATKLDQLRAEAAAAGKPTITVAAGDLIGASPLISAAFHDEPTIEAMNLAGLQVSSVGNHEFDEGYKELQRMDAGGCLPDGDGLNNQNSCPDESQPFPGANFDYLAANVKETATGQTILPATSIKTVNGVKVGFIGMTLEATPNIVTKSGVAGLEFGDEVETANALVPKLKVQGVKTIVVLLHEGGLPTGGYNECPGISGPIVDIAHGLSSDIDAIVSGHTHAAYNCKIADPAGNPRLVTSASSFGRLVTDINLTINTKSGDVIRATSDATNEIVDRNGTPDPAMTALVAKYKELVRPIESKVIGQVATHANITKTQNPAGESPLGDLIGDAQLADPSTISNGVEPLIAFMNPGGIRADLTVDPDTGDVTYGSAFTVQPFNNFLVSMDMTGAQIEALLEQQFGGVNAAANKVLQISAGFTYTWNAAGPANDKIDPATIKLDGVTLDPATSYRIVTNNFLSDGGDGFPAFTLAQNKLFGGLDIDAFANYLTANSPYTPVPTDRITRIG